MAAPRELYSLRTVLGRGKGGEADPWCEVLKCGFWPAAATAGVGVVGMQ